MMLLIKESIIHVFKSYTLNENMHLGKKSSMDVETMAGRLMKNNIMEESEDCL